MEVRPWSWQWTIGAIMVDRGQGGDRAGRGPAWWRTLTSWGRLSLVGLVAAALLAVGLGVFIPRQVEKHMLQSETASNTEVLQALLGTATLQPTEGNGFIALDRFVRQSILHGYFVRVKLWNLQGEVLYSDQPRLVGQRFPPSDQLRKALAGTPQAEISDLSDVENTLDRDLGSRALEFYLPVRSGGRVLAVWEVYQSLHRFDAELGQIRVAVWVSVGAGLLALLVFLVSSFGSLLSTVQRRRREAEQRSRELGTLLEVSHAVGGSLAPDLLATDAARTIRRAGDFRAVALVEHPDDGSPARKIASDLDSTCPVLCPLFAPRGTGRPAPGCASLAVEVAGPSGRLALVACRQAPSGFTSRERALLEAAAEQVRIALENARLYDSLKASQGEQRRLTAELVSAHEEERKWVVGEIHDGLGQDLHTILFRLRGSRSGTPEEEREELDRVEALVEQSIVQLRRLLQDLRPSTLEDVGLVASLWGLADRAWQQHGLRVEVKADGVAEPPVPVRVAVFRIAQEALRNVVKHTGTDRAEIDLRRQDGFLSLRVSDRGTGGAASGEGEGLGLWLMRERAEALGGTLEVGSSRQGTTVTARVPVEAPSEPATRSADGG
jgi:signal transduction histidine kinase